MPSALVGETHIPRDFKRYARQYSFLEIDCDPGTVPGKPRLQSCRALAPEEFIFSLVLPSSLASLEVGETADRVWKGAQSVAQILRPRWWVVRTPSSVRPTRKAREDLARLFERLRAPEVRIAWEPHGLWEDAAASETATALGVHLIQDIAQQAPAPAPVLYARILAFGRGARIGLGLAERVAERVREFSEAFVAVEGQGAGTIARALGLAVDADASELSELDPEEPELESDSSEIEEV